MKNIVYIGVNGIGKSKKLDEEYKKDKMEENSILIKYSEKSNAPDSNVINKNNEVINKFEKFLENLFSFETLINLKNLSDSDQNKFKKIKKETKSEDELKEIWNKLTNDPNLKFLKNEGKSIPKIIISNKDNDKINEFEISKKMYTFNLEDWKTTKTSGIKNYGTGKLVYFQIKFIYEHLDLLKESKNNKYLIIDEPELFLHPSLKREVGYMLKQIGQKINVIISTHSATFLNSFYNEDNCEIFSKKNHDEKWIKIELEKPYVFSSRQIYFETLMASKIVIVEGSNDVKLIEYIIHNYKCKNKDIFILMSQGKDKISNNFDIVKGIKHDNNNSLFDNEKIFILFDKDKDKINKKHKEWNQSIEKLKCKNYGFENDLEKHFWIKKETWDIDNFFSIDKNKKELNIFIKESKLENFLEIENI